MAENEMLDIVDSEGNVIGTAPRHEFHQNPNIIHQVVHCWIFNKQGQILWQQRSFRKVQSPGEWDMSCGGHILSGDTPDESLQRELEEELGIKDSKPEFVEKYLRGNKNQTELINLFYVVVDKPSSEFTLQKEEVEKVEWIDVDKAITLVFNKERESTDFIYTQLPRILQSVFAKNCVV